MRIIDFFDRGVRLNPSRICLRDASVARSYAEVQASSYRIANALISDGLQPEAKAAVYSSNGAVAFECVLGIMRAGAAWVPVNAKNSVSDNAYILDNCDVEAIFYHSEFEANLAELRRDCPKLRQFICIDRAGGSGPYLQDWIASAPETDPDIAERPEAISTIFSSGGTTGRPKGTPWTDRVWETMIANFLLAMPVNKPPVHLVIAPMTHAAGGVGLILMSVGATNVILPGFDASSVMEAIAREKVTHLFLPPTAIYMLLAHPGVRRHDYSSLEYFIYAAAPMSVDRLKECLEVFGPVMTQTFGQAEAPMVCTVLSPKDHLPADDSATAKALCEERLSSCGYPTLLTPLAIMDDDGKLLPAGERGEIVVRGSMVIPGYYKNPEATREASAFGWHHTGDVGYFDGQGYLHIVDRKKDMIISGGFNIYPGEVEQVIWGHPAVQDCAVIGVPDDKWGEAVKAVVELKAGAKVTEDELIRLCKEKVGSVKAPKSVDFWETLPRSPVGKVRKKDIRARFWEGRTRAI